MDELGPHADLKEPGRGRYPGNPGYKIRLEVDEGRLFSGNDQLNVRDGGVMCQIVSELGMGISPSPRDFSRFPCGCQILRVHGPAWSSQPGTPLPRYI